MSLNLYFVEIGSRKNQTLNWNVKTGCFLNHSRYTSKFYLSLFTSHNLKRFFCLLLNILVWKFEEVQNDSYAFLITLHQLFCHFQENDVIWSPMRFSGWSYQSLLAKHINLNKYFGVIKRTRLKITIKEIWRFLICRKEKINQG